MKIANKTTLPNLISAPLAAAFLLTLGVTVSFSTLAADVPPPSPPMAMDANAPLPVSPAANTAPELTKNVIAMEDKVTGGAKDVVKKLDASSDAMTLDDLNSAKQTVARIEAMIDLEKHLNELDKLRNDRTNAHNTALASAIPASALMPPPSQHQMPMSGMGENERPHPLSSGTEISRIVGSEGRYSAVLKIDGATKTVRVGDMVGGGTVRFISASSVVIEDKGETRTLHIKNVDAIFSTMR